MSPSVLPHLLIKKIWRTLICHSPRLFLWGVLQAKFQLLQMKEFTKGAINSALRNLKAPYVSLVKTNKISLNGHVDSFLINTQFRRWMCRNLSKIFMRKCKQLLSWHRHVIEHHHSEIGWKEKFSSQFSFGYKFRWFPPVSNIWERFFQPQTEPLVACGNLK